MVIAIMRQHLFVVHYNMIDFEFYIKRLSAPG